MKQIFTYALAATVSCCTVIAHAQSKILATEFYSASSETATTFEPLDASNAYDNDLSTYAVMRAIAQLILPPFDPAKSSEMEIGFDETIPGGTPITLAFSELSGPGLLSVLLGGTLGSALNAVLFATAGNPQIEITVLDSDNNPVVNSSYGMACIYRWQRLHRTRRIVLHHHHTPHRLQSCECRISKHHSITLSVRTPNRI